MKVYVAAGEELRKTERQDETQCTIKIAKNYLECKLFRFVIFSFLVTRLMPYYAKTDGSHSLIAGLLQISLLSNDFRNKNLEVTVATFVTKMSIQKSSHVTSEMHMI